MCWKQLFVVAVLVRGSLAAPLFDASVDGFSLSVGVTAAAAVLAIASLVVIALGKADRSALETVPKLNTPYEGRFLSLGQPTTSHSKLLVAVWDN